MRKNRELLLVGGDTIGYQATDSDPIYADVRAISANDTGVYRISTKPIDLAAGDKSTTSIATFNNSTAVIQSAIEVADDVDFHRIALKQGEAYRIRPSLFDRYELTLPNGVTRSLQPNFFGTNYFSAPISGDYFISVDSKDSTSRSPFHGYTLTIDEGYSRPAFSGKFTWPDTNNPFIGRPINNINDITFQYGDEVEVYSTLPLTADNSQTLSAGQLHRITFEQWKSVVPTGQGSLGSTGELFSRAFRANGSVGPWTNVLLIHQPVPNEIADGFVPENVTNYAFADGLPAYLENDPDYASFESLSPVERSTISKAINSWNILTLFSVSKRQIEPGENNDAAPTMIYKAALSSGQPVVSFPDADGIGGDLILNTNSSLIADLSEGSEAYFEVLRGVGITFGLKETEAFGRDQSVMGARTSAELEDFPFPSTPLALDERAVGGFSSTGNLVTHSLSGTPFYSFVNNFENGTISAQDSALASVIDLRGGQKSFSRSGDEQPYTLVNSNTSRLGAAIGGENSDFLFGNEANNRLEGNAGNDVLSGGAGNDALLGGAGDDIYIFRPGYGDDTISDLSGTEVLRIEGMHNLDRLQDLTFERIGNDLLIRLELDATNDLGGDSIQIANMANPASSIEALTLLNPDGPVTRIDLPAMFNQLSSPRQRFRVTADRGAHGQLVVPV